MTAVGFFIASVVLLIALMVDNEPEWLETILGWVLAAGLAILVIGASRWLWIAEPSWLR